MKIVFTWNNQEMEVDAPPHLRLSALVDQLSTQPSSYFSCHNGRCGKCLVELNDLLVYSCLTTSFELRGQHLKSSDGLVDATWLNQFAWAKAITQAPLCVNCHEARLLSVIHYLERSKTTAADLEDYLELVQCRCTSYHRVAKLFSFMQRMRDRYAK